MGIRLGFTGSQIGCTIEQISSLDLLLYGRKGENQFHHGDCIGSDAIAHKIAQAFDYQIHIHPPTDDSKRAYCRGAYVIHSHAPYLVRNCHIVDYTDRLIATPKDFEVLRSGTWATIRYARRMGRPIAIIRPSGIIDYERWDHHAP